MQNDPSDEWAPVLLTPEVVADWHHDGGTNLSSARGGFDQEVIISFLKKHRINQLYVLGSVVQLLTLTLKEKKDL